MPRLDRLDYAVLGLFVFLVLLNAGDVVSTYIALTGGGPFHEANPIAAWLFQRFGILPAAIVGKTLVLIVIGASIWWIVRKFPRQDTLWDERYIIVLLALNGTLFVVVSHNFSLLGYLNRPEGFLDDIYDLLTGSDEAAESPMEEAEEGA